MQQVLFYHEDKNVRSHRTVSINIFSLFFFFFGSMFLLLNASFKYNFSFVLKATAVAYERNLGTERI